jgi:hypothetical protein
LNDIHKLAGGPWFLANEAVRAESPMLLLPMQVRPSEHPTVELDKLAACFPKLITRTFPASLEDDGAASTRPRWRCTATNWLLLPPNPPPANFITTWASIVQTAQIMFQKFPENRAAHSTPTPQPCCNTEIHPSSRTNIRRSRDYVPVRFPSRLCAGRQAAPPSAVRFPSRLCRATSGATVSSASARPQSGFARESDKCRRRHARLRVVTDLRTTGKSRNRFWDSAGPGSQKLLCLETKVGYHSFIEIHTLS